MKVVIVEDEIAASENLSYLIHQLDPDIEILTVLDSVKTAVSYFSKSNDAELVFMDIHLADGLSFEIFDKVALETPVIFTTAYDQYAIKAFKVNSVDYLLKPIAEDELEDAIDKYRHSKEKQNDVPDTNNIQGLMDLLQRQNTSYKSTYLVHHRGELLPIKVEEIAYCYIETGIVKATTFKNQSFTIDKKLEDIEGELDPQRFHRVNRQFIINRDAVAKIKFYFNGKLIVNVNPPFSERIVVSKAKASEVKTWMNQ